MQTRSPSRYILPYSKIARQLITDLNKPRKKERLRRWPTPRSSPQAPSTATNFATNEVSTQREVVAEIFGNADAFQSAELDDRRYPVPVERLLELEIVADTVYAFVNQPRFVEIPVSIANDLLTFQSDVRKARAAGQEVQLTVKVA